MDEYRERITRELGLIFRIPTDDYVTEVKLLYIYDWVGAPEGVDPYIIIAVLRKVTKRPSNREVVDALYGRAADARLRQSGLLAPSGASAPANRNLYVSGWRL